MAEKSIEEILGHVTQFGRLAVLREGDGYRGMARGRERVFRNVRCRCECGAERDFQPHKLRSGQTVSCGCYAAQRASEGNRTHGMTHTGAHRSWQSMIQRCENPNATDYGLYGGKGVKVCERWRRSFEAFYADMGARPEGMTLDRIKRNQGYEPGNCQWATAKQQTANRSNMRYHEIDGRMFNLCEAEREFGITRQTLRKRLKKGMTLKEAVSA